MATHAALASTRIPTSTRFPSKASHSFPTQCASRRLEVAEFSGLKSTSCITYASNARESSFSDVVAAQLATKAIGSTAVRGETVAKLKVAINGFGRIGRNFLRCWHGRKDSPLEVIVVNDSGGVKNASHLLKYDSMLGTFKADVKILNNGTITVDGKPILVVSSRDPLKLPWAELGIDIVSLVLPQLKGKLNGIALRVPTPNVSVVDLVVNVAKKGYFSRRCQCSIQKGS
uniref:Glyceraldehyde 3-phosphate dehydrogenase NAD(P) binding domain-containing protein n=1 Tax=Medicago truncatula TaxID=3880 RepID=B7FKM5_MEDTR|nr:unknown [Medicago truncatula]